MGFGWKSILGVVAAPFTGGASLALTAYDQAEQTKKKQEKAQEEAEQAAAGLVAQQVAGAKEIQTLANVNAAATATTATPESVLQSSVNTLVDVLKGRTQQPVYVTPAAAAPAAAPNYLLYLAAGTAAVYLMFRLKTKR